MATPIISKFMFTITFPTSARRHVHADPMKLHSLARKELSDTDVIDTIEHLFKCHRCFEEYRYILTSYHQTSV